MSRDGDHRRGPRLARRRRIPGRLHGPEDESRHRVRRERRGRVRHHLQRVRRPRARRLRRHSRGESAAVIIANARILTFDSSNRVLDAGAVEIRRDGVIGAVSPAAPQGRGVVDAGGRLLMPALINCHTHLYSTLARGMPMPGRPPRNFPEILRKLWWRLDWALHEEDIYYSALVGLIDSAR